MGVYAVHIRDQHIYLNLVFVQAYLRKCKADMPRKMKSVTSPPHSMRWKKQAKPYKAIKHAVALLCAKDKEI